MTQETKDNFRPIRADVDSALEKAKRLYCPEGLIDPLLDERYAKGNFWRAKLFAPNWDEPSIGLGDNPGEAAAFAWLVAQDPDILIDGVLNEDNWTDDDPYTIPEEYRLEVERGEPHDDTDWSESEDEKA
jgi:hypothetical protein